MDLLKVEITVCCHIYIFVMLSETHSLHKTG